MAEHLRLDVKAEIVQRLPDDVAEIVARIGFALRRLLEVAIGKGHRLKACLRRARMQMLHRQRAGRFVLPSRFVPPGPGLASRPGSFAVASTVWTSRAWSASWRSNDGSSGGRSAAGGIGATAAWIAVTFID